MVDNLKLVSLLIVWDVLFLPDLSFLQLSQLPNLQNSQTSLCYRLDTVNLNTVNFALNLTFSFKSAYDLIKDQRIQHYIHALIRIST